MSVPEVDFRSLDALRIFSATAFRSHREGSRRGRTPGGRMEFIGHRRYVAGDDPRRVDWNVAARSDRLVVKEHLRESALPVHLLIDVSRSMTLGDPSALEMARALARGLAYVALKHGDTVALAGLADTVQGYMRTSGHGGLARVDDALARFVPAATTDLDRAMRAYIHRVRRPGAVILLSDLLDEEGYGRAVRTLQIAQFEVAVVHVIGKELLQPELPPEASVQDAETGATRDVAWDTDTRAAYASRVEAFLGRVEAVSAGSRIRYARARTDSPVTDVFVRELREARILV